MSADAAFEDADHRALRLRAEVADDLAVISALIQDAVTECARVSWLPKRRRFTILLNRFRWEVAPKAERDGRPYERVQSLLVVEGALRARAQKLDPKDRGAVICLLSARFEAGEDGAGTLHFALAGGGTLAVDVECLDVALVDVSQPYPARAPQAPQHGLDPLP